MGLLRLLPLKLKENTPFLFSLLKIRNSVIMCSSKGLFTLTMTDHHGASFLPSLQAHIEKWGILQFWNKTSRGPTRPEAYRCKRVPEAWYPASWLLSQPPCWPTVDGHWGESICPKHQEVGGYFSLIHRYLNHDLARNIFQMCKS